MSKLSPINEIDELLLEEVATSNTLSSQLVVFNDDYNTFDWVIQCFIEVCNHSYEQSEQLSLIIHFKGKAIVKAGSLNELKAMKDELINRGLSATIESLVEE